VRADKEAFVTGLQGTSVVGALLPALVLPVALWLLGNLVVLLRLPGYQTRRQALPSAEASSRPPAPHGAGARSRAGGEEPPFPDEDRTGRLLDHWGHPRGLPWFIVEAAVLFVPLLACLCSSPESWTPMAIIMAISAAGVATEFYLRQVVGVEKRRGWELLRARRLFAPRKAFLSFIRGGSMLVTCVSILAVDFPIFPRGHGKTEEFGVSLMDLGIGVCLVFSGASSRWARGTGHSNRREQHREPTGGEDGTGVRSLLQSHRFIVALLGLARFVVLKFLGYQEHVSEYGLHWNFFLTLNGVWLASDLLSKIPVHPLIPSVGCLLVYQLALIVPGGGLTEWVMSGDRSSSFVAANREGLLGLVACVFLYLAGASLSRALVFRPASGSQRRITSAWLVRLAFLMLSCIGLWCIFSCATLVQPTSRRLGNLAYCLFVLACSCTLLAAFLAVECLAVAPPSSVILHALNRRPFSTFMLANLLTGAANLALDTLHSSSTAAVATLIAYLLVWCGLPVWLEDRVLSTEQLSLKQSKGMQAGGAVDTKRIQGGTGEVATMRRRVQPKLKVSARGDGGTRLADPFGGAAGHAPGFPSLPAGNVTVQHRRGPYS